MEATQVADKFDNDGWPFNDLFDEEPDLNDQDEGPGESEVDEETGLERELSEEEQQLLADALNEIAEAMEEVTDLLRNAFMLDHLIGSGKVVPDDPTKPADYWGSPEHQVNLSHRLGIEAVKGQEVTDELWEQLYRRFQRAQTEGVDEDGNPLFASDYRVLSWVTGWSA